METINTSRGFRLQVEQQEREGQFEIDVTLEGARPQVLHWGLQQRDGGPWQIPPRTFWPAGTNPVDDRAVQTPFPAPPAAPRIAIRLASPPRYTTLEFVLFDPEQKSWDNNRGRNYRVEISSPTEKPQGSFDVAFQELTGHEPALFQRAYDLAPAGRLGVVVRKEAGQFRCEWLTDLPGDVLLHWGVAPHSMHDWQLPPGNLGPPGSVVRETAVQTPFTNRTDSLSELRLEIPESEAPLGICFVLTDTSHDRWFKDGRANFFLPLGTPAPETTIGEPELGAIANAIIEGEMGNHGWTLMHRFNLCHDLLERVRDSVEGLALLFVWLRFSAIRQLTWQRNYNTKPRELSHAQDRLTLKLADVYRGNPAGRPLVRLMLGAVGRGGEGQRIRDEILVIMHRHHVKEVTGHFMEEWHQKLHNNTTPDDVVICEAYLEFLRSNGDRGRFYHHLEREGVTRARLESFERPIRTEPDFVPHLKDALIHDFENFLRILKSVHAGTDLETAMNAARSQLDDEVRHLLGELWRQRNDPHLPLTRLAEWITQLRRRLRERIEQSGSREVLYLDLALEAALRGAIERNIHLQLSGDQLVELTGQLIENLQLSETEPEFALCLRHLKRLTAGPRFGRDWSLHAKSVLDRTGRVLSGVIDGMHVRLQSKAEMLGHAFHAEPWTITLFSEEVVRGGSLGFTLSMLLHHLDPLLRQSAQLGSWQIVSRGHGSGTIEVVETLRSIQGRPFDQPAIILADKVMGDEEVPAGVVAVIAPDVTDLVSHVAVRARNAGLLFATCHDPAIFEQLKSLRGRRLQLELNAAGDVVWADAGDEPRPATASSTRSVSMPSQRPRFKRYAIGLSEFEEGLVGEKSLNQSRLHGRLPESINLPASVALPFAVFDQVLSCDQNQPVAGQCGKLLKELAATGEFVPVLGKLREAVLNLEAPPELIDELCKTMRQGGLPPPDPWESAWTCIKRVWASKWNERAFLSRRANGIADEGLYMAVLVQQVVAADYAFVIHTVNPATTDPDELYAEVVPGLGETLVGNHPGRALSFVWNKKSGTADLRSYPGKSIGLFGGGLIFRSDSNGEDLGGYAGAGLYDSVVLPEPTERLLDYSQERLVWDESFRGNLFRTIAQTGFAVAEAMGKPQDVEGAWTDGRCHVVQTRPQVGLDHG